jgi:hypothetical protein
MSFYGIAMFDAWTNLISIEQEAYWRYGIYGNHPRWSIDVGFDDSLLGGRSGLQYRIAEQVSLPFLAIANVGYILSPVPLVGETLRYLDGPSRPSLDRGIMKTLDRIEGNKDQSDATGTNGAPGSLSSTNSSPLYRKIVDMGRWQRMLDRWQWRWDRIFYYDKVYVYQIEDALPRVYTARDVIVMPDDTDWLAFLGQVGESGPQRGIVVRAKDSQTILGKAAPAEVQRFELVVDGYDIVVDAPDGGVIVINAANQPFFTGTADGVAIPLVSVNGIQTALAVPPGARDLKIRYHRPTVGERLTTLH